MREILFRGKRVDNEEWIEGYLYKTKNSISYGDKPFSNCFIIPETDSLDFKFMGSGSLLSKQDLYHVIPETVGQFIGLTDKNGVKIFEGDIINSGDKNITYIVEWHDTGLKARQTGNMSYIGLTYWRTKLEVTGNIHDKN